MKPFSNSQSNLAFSAIWPEFLFLLTADQRNEDSGNEIGECGEREDEDEILFNFTKPVNTKILESQMEIFLLIVLLKNKFPCCSNFLG